MTRRATLGGGIQQLRLSATAGMLNWAHVDASGLARIDFAILLDHPQRLHVVRLPGPATQFGSVKSAVYSFDGSVSAFSLWLQMVPPSMPAVTGLAQAAVTP